MGTMKVIRSQAGIWSAVVGWLRLTQPPLYFWAAADVLEWTWFVSTHLDNSMVYGAFTVCMWALLMGLYACSPKVVITLHCLECWVGLQADSLSNHPSEHCTAAISLVYRGQRHLCPWLCAGRQGTDVPTGVTARLCCAVLCPHLMKPLSLPSHHMLAGQSITTSVAAPPRTQMHTLHPISPLVQHTIPPAGIFASCSQLQAQPGGAPHLSAEQQNRQGGWCLQVTTA